MWRTIPIVAALSLLVGYGLVEGFWTNRWVPSKAVESAAARLNDVPMTIGEWKATASDLPPRETEAGQIAGYLYRNYVNRRTRAALSVLVVCGQPGPICVHSPEVCYPSAGYREVAKPVNHAVPMAGSAAPATFKVATYLSGENALPDRLRILWSWNAGGGWQAPDNPRLEFSRSAALYKLYVVRHTPRDDEPLDKEPALEFIQRLIPELEKSLFAAP